MKREASPEFTGIRTGSCHSVFLMPVYNFNTETGTQTTSPNEFTVENADWTYRLVNDFGYSISAGVVAVDHKVTFNSTGEKANFGVKISGSSFLSHVSE